MHHRIWKREERQSIRASLRYNFETGRFFWKRAVHGYGGWFEAGDEATGALKDGYIKIGVAGRHYPAHHLAWFLMKRQQVPFHLEIHHRDDNPRNNRWSNLECLSRKRHSAYAKVDATGNLLTPAAKRIATRARISSEKWQEAVTRPRTAAEIAAAHTPAAEAKHARSARRTWSDPTLRAEQSERLKTYLSDPKNYEKRVSQLQGVQKKATDAAAAKVKSSIWITDGKVGKRMPSDVAIPAGWRRGKPDYRSNMR